MIWFFTPYSFEKKLFEAYDRYMQLMPDEEDWGCLMDGDMAFLQSDFGNELQDYIDANPGTALFTCYGSRCPYGHQMAPGVNYESESLRYIYENTVKLRQNNHLKVLDLKQRIAGHLMLIQKKTWVKYREAIAEHAVAANIQAVDTAISDVLLKNNEKILLMQGLQVFHYYRQFNRTEKHILSDKLTVVIRTHDRPEAFRTCIESVRRQTHKNIDIVVGVDTPGSYDYVLPYNVTRIVKCEPRERTSNTDFPANGYISNLVKDINDGYILILDDDNYLADPQGVEKLFRQIDKEWCVYMIRYRYADGRKFPNDSQFARKVIENGGVDWASHVFHARFKNVSESKPLYNGDYHWISAMAAHVKTQKWIDLDLVHTKTPGQNGKTEAPPPKPYKSNVKGKVDVVYVLGTGSKWNNTEIRFSLRSLEKNLINFGKVFVVGECPDFLQNVIHIPASDIFNPQVNADGNIINKVLAACADERLSDNFLFINDDHMVIKPIEAAAVPPLHKGDMRTYLPDFWKVNFWRKRLKRTMDELKRQGLTTFHFDCHTPIVFNKKQFQEAMQQFAWQTDIGFTMKSLYGNIVYAENNVLLTDQKRTIFQSLTLKPIAERLAIPTFMSFNDDGLNNSLKWWLIDNFRSRSQFEKDYPQDKVFDLYFWEKNGRPWADGVAAFKKYWKNPHLQEMFDIGETPVLRKKLEFKMNQLIGNL